MNGLMLHCGAHQVELSDVERVHTPEPEGSHYPIPHSFLVNQTKETLRASGLEVIDEAHALNKEGARYFGLMQVKPGYTEDDDWGMVVGLRNSHDKSFSSSLVVGNKVFVCDNLCFSGEIKIARKHTRFIRQDIPGLMGRAVGMLNGLRLNQEERYGHYKEAQHSKRDVRDAIFRAVEGKVIAQSKLLQVWHEWQEPSHEEHADFGNSVWRLQQAFTEVQKGSNVFSLPKAQQGLQGILDPLAGFVGRQFTMTTNDILNGAIDVEATEVHVNEALLV